MLSRLQTTVSAVREELDAYDTTSAGRSIATLVDDLSNWYVRRSRRRFWNPGGDQADDDKTAAYLTLHELLVAISKLLAPLTPFIADAIYSNLDGTEPSVHLCDYPDVDASLIDKELEFDMTVARRTVELGRAARSQAKVKVRQPLPEAIVVADERERAAIVRLEELVLDELNVKSVSYVTEADELARYEVKPNFRALGPRFGSKMPQAKAAIEALDPAHVAAAFDSGASVGVSVDGKDHTLTGDDLQLVMLPRDGYQLERQASYAVALRLDLDDALLREGAAREVVHAIQNARKAAGLEVEDRIEVWLVGRRRSDRRPCVSTVTTSPARRWRPRSSLTAPGVPTACTPRAPASTGQSWRSRCDAPVSRSSAEFGGPWHPKLSRRGRNSSCAARGALRRRQAARDQAAACWPVAKRPVPARAGRRSVPSAGRRSTGPPPRRS